jgi:hypothetical protein
MDDDEPETTGPIWSWILPICSLLIGASIGGAVALKWEAFLDAHNVGQFAVVFFTSAGFGGLATVVAAIVAVFGVSRQLRQAAAIAQKERRRLDRIARDAEWWRAFEWATSKVFSSTASSNAVFGDDLAYSVATGLRERARTGEQKHICDALVEQISSRRPVTPVAQDPEAAPVAEEGSSSSASPAAFALQSYLLSAANGTDVPRDFRMAESRLLELRAQEAVEELAQKDGAVRIVAGTLRGAYLGQPDITLLIDGREAIVELKRYRDPAPGMVRRAAAGVEQLAAGRPALLIVSTGSPLSPTAVAAVQREYLGVLVRFVSDQILETNSSEELSRVIGEWVNIVRDEYSR